MASAASHDDHDDEIHVYEPQARQAVNERSPLVPGIFSFSFLAPYGLDLLKEYCDQLTVYYKGFKYSMTLYTSKPFSKLLFPSYELYARARHMTTVLMTSWF